MCTSWILCIKENPDKIKDLISHIILCFVILGVLFRFDKKRTHYSMFCYIWHPPLCLDKKEMRVYCSKCSLTALIYHELVNAPFYNGSILNTFNNNLF